MVIMYPSDWNNNWTNMLSPRDARRGFSPAQKWYILNQQNGKCAECGKHLDPSTAQFHHGRPWADGGRTVVRNGKALCPVCHAKMHAE